MFCQILGVQGANFEDLVEEAKHFEVGDSLAQVTSIFHTMERLLKEPGDHESSKMDLFRLRFHNVFPVSKNWNLDTDRVSAFQTAAGVTSGEWFIADTAPLRTNFAGIVPLLDIKLDDLAPMDHVLDELKLKDRFLSQKARSIPRTQGHVEFKEELTEHFRSKVDIIIRFVTPVLLNISFIL